MLLTSQYREISGFLAYVISKKSLLHIKRFFASPEKFRFSDLQTYFSDLDLYGGAVGRCDDVVNAVPPPNLPDLHTYCGNHWLV